MLQFACQAAVACMCRADAERGSVSRTPVDSAAGHHVQRSWGLCVRRGRRGTARGRISGRHGEEDDGCIGRRSRTPTVMLRSGVRGRMLWAHWRILRCPLSATVLRTGDDKDERDQEGDKHHQSARATLCASNAAPRAAMCHPPHSYVAYRCLNAACRSTSSTFSSGSTDVRSSGIGRILSSLHRGQRTSSCGSSSWHTVSSEGGRLTPPQRCTCRV
jgi:hypothetical protein